jgi:hypothetical protein
MDKEPEMFMELATSLSLLVYLDVKVTIWLGVRITEVLISIFGTVVTLVLDAVDVEDGDVGETIGISAGGTMGCESSGDERPTTALSTHISWV